MLGAWAREFFKWATLAKSPIAQEVVRRIDELFANERAINGKPANERRALRQERSKPLIVSIEAHLREQCSKLSSKHDLAKAMSYLLSPVGGLHPLSRRRTGLPLKQCRRTRAAGCGHWETQLDLCRIRPRRAPSRRHLFAHPDLQIKRRRPPRPGSPSCLPNCPIIPPRKSTSCFPGIGRPFR